MTKEELDFLIQQGEGYNLEFKESYNQSLAREICAMANSMGGKILIGVTDDGKLKSSGFNNKIRSEIQSLVRNFDESPNEKFSFDKDFNEDAYKNFLDEIGVETKLSREDVLKNLELSSGGMMKNAGALLFCKKATRISRNATIVCALFMGKTKTKVIDSKEFDADLLTNYISAFDYLRSKLNTEYIMTGGPREEVLELPEKALREALLNAIAHRDYFSSANIQISIYSDRVVIDNPGGLVGKMKVEDLYKKSYPRNNLLFGLMQRMELVEKIGSGLLRINEMMDEYLLPHPIIEATDVYFGISFERPDLQKMSVEQRMKEYNGVGEQVGDKLGDKLGENQEKIIDLMKNNRNITIPELSLKLDISTTAVENNLAKLKEKGLIMRIGPDKGGYWEVIK
ncbi:MAG: ATP-binding protein [bacterium]|nr:ATP-binding protein [bacterium]